MHIEVTVSSQLDPLRTQFDEAEAVFLKAYKSLEAWKDSDASSVQTDMAALEKALRTMETALNTTGSTATTLYTQYKGNLSSNFVAERTMRLKDRFLDARGKKEGVSGAISGGAQVAFANLWPMIQTYPLKNMPTVERLLGLLKAVGSPTVTTIDNRLEDVAVVMDRLKAYKTQVVQAQADADELWKAGKLRDSQQKTAEFLGSLFTVTEFKELFRFHVRVTAVPGIATIRVLNDTDKAHGAPRDLDYTAADGLRFEVAAPGFQSLTVEIPGIKGGFNAAMLMEKLPYEQKVVLTKVPAWTAPLGSAGGECPPVPTADGKTLVAADRNGFVYLLSTEDGRKLKTADCRSLSGFRGSPLVTADSVYAATADGAVIALDLATLKERWRKDPADGPGPVYGSPALAGGLLVVAATPIQPATTGRVIAYDAATGEVKWEAKIEAGTAQGLVWARGWIYATCEDGRGRTLSPDGKESVLVLPSAREDAGYPPPRSRTLVVGDRVLLGLDGPGKEFSLVELPLPGTASPHIGYKWGALVPKADVSGACMAGEDIYLVFSNGTAWRVSSRVGPRPNDPKARAGAEKEMPLKEPAFQEGLLFIATDKGLTAARPGTAEFVEAWKWTCPEGDPITTAPMVVGKFVIVGSRDGRVFAFLRD